MYSLNADKLSLLIEYFTEHNSLALNALLINNFDGKTPLDISMSRDSTKTTDLMLKAIANFDEGSYSKQIYKEFPKLVIKGLNSFLDYLDTCTFQTVQMKNMKYLALPNADEDKVLAAHSSCLLDRHFLSQEHISTNALSGSQNNEYMEAKKKLFSDSRILKRRKDKLLREEKKLKQNDDKSKQNITKNPSNKLGASPDDVILTQKDQFKESNEDEDDEEQSPSWNSEEEESEEEDENVNDEDDNEEDEGANEEDEKGEEKTVKPSLSAWAQSLKFGGNTDSRFSEIIIEKKKIAQEEKDLKIREKKIEKERHINIEKNRKGMKRYDIRAIEFDWLFNENEGKEFLKALIRTENIEIFSISTISNIILFLWGYYRFQIVLQVLIPFLIYFTVFILYSTWVNHEKNEEGSDNGDDKEYAVANLCMLILVMLGILWMGYFELRQLLYYKWSYFGSFWNWIDISSLSMNVVAIVTDLAGINDRHHIPILAIATLLMWCKLCYFGRIFLQTAWMVRMIFSVAYDMGYFLLVFSIMVLAFANTNFILARNGEPRYTGGNFWFGIIDSYRTGIGDFRTDDYENNRDEILVWVIWLMNTFLIFIVLLNMLIAIISDTFERVHESIFNNLLKELSILMVETELLVSRKRLFKNKKYLIIIEKETGETSKVDAESKLQIVKISMEKKVEEQKVILDTLNNDFEEFVENELESKAMEYETATNRELGKLTEKVEKFESMIGELQGVLERGRAGAEQ